jgi:hypothetical protein
MNMSAATTALTERLTFEAYVAVDAVHATGLKHMLVSPLQYKYWRDHDRPDSDTFRAGRAIHTAILQPERFLADYVLWDGGIRRGKEWEAFKAKAGERTILKQEQYELALKLRDSAHAHGVARKYVTHPDRRVEVSMQWTHKRTGLRCKSRADLISCGALSDVKSTRDPCARKFSADAARLGYAMQLALYRDGVLETTGELLPVKIIAAQSVAPYDVCVFDLPAETLAIGSEQLERALDLVAECTASGKWPGLAPDEEISLHLPAWATPEADGEEQLTMNGESLF